MTSPNCIFAVTLFALLHGVSSEFMAETGTWVTGKFRKCPSGQIDIMYFAGVKTVSKSLQLCAQRCVNYGQTCHYADVTYFPSLPRCRLYSAKCGDYNNNYDAWTDSFWVRNELHSDPARRCPSNRFWWNDDAMECWKSDGRWCIDNNFQKSEWGKWICNNCASCVPRGGTCCRGVESAIGDIKPVESAICDIDDKAPHKCARNINTFQKEEVIGFLSLTRSMWMGILSIVGLLAIVRSIYSVCTRKAGDTYEEV